MAIGLEVALLPGFAIARRLDCEGDWKRHLMLSPAIGLLVCFGLAGFTSIFEMTLSALTNLLIIANIIALIAIRVEINPIPKTPRLNGVRGSGSSQSSPVLSHLLHLLTCGQWVLIG